jgi:hypothetical protein
MDNAKCTAISVQIIFCLQVSWGHDHSSSVLTCAARADRSNKPHLLGIPRPSFRPINPKQWIADEKSACHQKHWVMGRPVFDINPARRASISSLIPLLRVSLGFAAYLLVLPGKGTGKVNFPGARLKPQRKVKMLARREAENAKLALSATV